MQCYFLHTLRPDFLFGLMELAIARWYITLQKGGNLILENEQGTAANAVKTAVTAKATELTAAKAAASAAAKATVAATAAAT